MSWQTFIKLLTAIVPFVWVVGGIIYERPVEGYSASQIAILMFAFFANFLVWIYFKKNPDSNVKNNKIDLGEVDVYIELYNGKILTKTIRGFYDEITECYSVAENRVAYFMEKVRKENVLEVDEGYFLNIRREIRSVAIGEKKSYIFTLPE